MTPKLTRLRILLFKAGISQAELARKLKISESTVSLLCTARLVPSKPMMRKVAKALKQDPQYIWPELFTD